MNIPFSRDILKNRPIPQKKKDIIINFENKGEEKQEIENQDLKHVKIIDKRNDYQLNRNEIMERMKQKQAFIVPISREIQSRKPIMPIEFKKQKQDEIKKTKETVVIEPEPLVSEPSVPEPPVSEPPVSEPPVPEPPVSESSAPEPMQSVQDQMPKKRGRPKKKTQEKIIIQDQDFSEVVINDTKISDRLPKMEKIALNASTYYLNNRRIFVNKVNELFRKYFDEVKKDKKQITCDDLAISKNSKFELLTHQKVIRDYLNLYTPYRGLLLYHGLGAGKTCGSIAIAEGMKSDKKVFILTPASLKMNFYSELKKCGDELYKKKQFWEFVSIEGKSEYVNVLSQVLNLSTDYIKNNGGAWLVNIKKEPNFETLSTNDRKNIDLQLDEMIRAKYVMDINYNGITERQLAIHTSNGTRNPFDNTCVVIDEAHNFVSRVVNKLKNPESLSYKLYSYLLDATNCKLVFLTGTPIINYPNEIGVLFNMLRGNIKTFTFSVNSTSKKITTEFVRRIFDKANFKTFDYIHYKDNRLIVTRNPYGFINTKKRGVLKGTQKQKMGGKNKTRKIKGGDELLNKYNGIKLDTTGNISDNDFVESIKKILKKNNIDIQEGNIKIDNNTALPDDPDEFKDIFIDEDTGNLKNVDLFQKRILGLTSYFRSASENLLPTLVRTDNNEDYFIIKSEMSDHQFSVYEKIRKIEADKERNQRRHKKLDKDVFNIASSYKLFSRSACNFAFPNNIERPQPPKKGKELTEDDINGLTIKERENMDTYVEEDKDNGEEDVNTYNSQIENALQLLSANDENGNSEFLEMEKLKIYSPKFYKLLENINDTENKGLHLLYSQFRTIEGIGILRLVLLANGYAEFKIKKTSDGYDIDEIDLDAGKPKFVLYTGTETSEVKEIIRNIYNSDWSYVPSNIVSKLMIKNENNYYGEIIKLFMITSSGAEGINLTNTRFVHIVEPYWNMVRIEQVIGRARRICSHKMLPPELRNVKVFLYISTLSDEQKTSNKNIELRDRDKSRLDNITPVTTDETLFEIALVKNNLNKQILHSIKETAIDCELYSSKDNDIVCYGYGKVSSNTFDSYPSFRNDKKNDKLLNQKTIEWIATELKIGDKVYALNDETNEVYDMDSYNEAVDSNGQVQPKYIGMFVQTGPGKGQIR